MNNKIKIAKQLVRIAKMLVAFNRNELEKQLKKNRSDLDEKSLKEHLDCLEKMDAKEQKVALHWINKKSLTLPDDLSKFNEAMNLVKKQHLDFQKFEGPMEVINRDDKSTLRIKSQDSNFNPSTEKTFSHPYNAGDGVIIYNVEDSKEGQKAVRRAIDFHFGYDKNFWCLASRYKKSGNELEKSWYHWKENSAYPKRIAFKNGKPFAFSAGKEKQHVEWWDRDNESHYVIPESNAVDDIEFLKKYGKLNLLDIKNISSELLEELADDENKSVRKEVAKNPNTPVDILTKLAEDKDAIVRCGVAENPSISAEVLVKLAEDENESVRYGIAENPRTPVDILTKLAEDKDWDVRYAVVENSKTPAEVLMKLADDEDDGVRKAVANHPNTPVEALRKLIDGEDKWVKEGVAKNPRTPVDILTKLAEDENWEVRSAVVENPRTPVEVLSKLVEDEDWYVRRAVVENPRTPAEILTKLAEDEDCRVRARVAKNPRTPVEVLKKLADDGDEWVREGVADNPNTPVEVLRKMAEDKALRVKYIAESQLRRLGQ